MFSCFHTWAVCRWLWNGSRQRAATCLGGTLVEFLLLLSQPYLLCNKKKTRHKHSNQSPQSHMPLPNQIHFHINTTVSSLSYCSICCHLTIQCGCSNAVLLSQESHTAMAAPPGCLMWHCLCFRLTEDLLPSAAISSFYKVGFFFLTHVCRCMYTPTAHTHPIVLYARIMLRFEEFLTASSEILTLLVPFTQQKYTTKLRQRKSTEAFEIH